jgi:hypothetical protein
MEVRGGVFIELERTGKGVDPSPDRHDFATASSPVSSRVCTSFTCR